MKTLIEKLERIVAEYKEKFQEPEDKKVQLMLYK